MKAIVVLLSMLILSACATTRQNHQDTLVAYFEREKMLQEERRQRVELTNSLVREINSAAQHCDGNASCVGQVVMAGAFAAAMSTMQGGSGENVNPMPQAPPSDMAVGLGFIRDIASVAVPVLGNVYMNRESQRTARAASQHQADMFTGMFGAVESVANTATSQIGRSTRSLADTMPLLRPNNNITGNGNVIGDGNEIDNSHTGGHRAGGDVNETRIRNTGRWNSPGNTECTPVAGAGGTGEETVGPGGSTGPFTCNGG